MNEVAERSIAFSLQIIKNEGVSVRGEISMKSSIPPRASRLEEVTLVHDDAVLPSPRSVLRHRPINDKTTTPLATQPKPHQGKGFITTMLITVLISLLLFLPVDAFGYPAWVNFNNHMTYGQYPTDHLDVNVGHGGISHLVSFMDGNKVTVIEIVNNKVHVFQIPTNVSGKRIVAMHLLTTNLGKNILLTIEGTLNEPMLINTGSTYEWSISH